MNTMNNVVDVSPFLLFEASADSETHQEHSRDEDDDKCYDDYGDDDESSRSQSTSRLTSFDSIMIDEEEEEKDAGEKEDHDDGDGVVNSYLERRERENLTVDSSSTGNDEKLTREIEKNRMFWEACLAS